MEKPDDWTEQEWKEFTERRMTDEELLDRAIAALKEHDWALGVFHRRHGPGPFEDVCCRPVTGDVTHVLAEAERREEEEDE